MPYLVSNNIINNTGVTVTVENATINGNPSDLTDVTPQSNINTPQLADSYIFQLNGNKLKITISNIDDMQDNVGFVGILGIDFPFVQVNHIDFISGVNNTTVTQSIDIDHPVATGEDKLYNLYFINPDGINNNHTVVIDITINDFAANHQIGHIFVGKHIPIKVSPDIKRSGRALNESDTSNGGQKYYSKPIFLKSISANITVLKKVSYDLFNNLVNSTGLSQPMLYVNDIITTESMYCTFSSIPTITTIKAKDDTGWLHTAQLNLIENK